MALKPFNTFKNAICDRTRILMFDKETSMKCHDVDHTIIGHEMQMVEVELDPGETVVAEAGAMNYLDDGIDFEAKMGENLGPHRGIFDGGDDRQGAATVRTVGHVDREQTGMSLLGRSIHTMSATISQHSNL